MVIISFHCKFENRHAFVNSLAIIDKVFRNQNEYNHTFKSLFLMYRVWVYLKYSFDFIFFQNHMILFWTLIKLSSFPLILMTFAHIFISIIVAEFLINSNHNRY